MDENLDDQDLNMDDPGNGLADLAFDPADLDTPVFDNEGDDIRTAVARINAAHEEIRQLRDIVENMTREGMKLQDEKSEMAEELDAQRSIMREMAVELDIQRLAMRAHADQLASQRLSFQDHHDRMGAMMTAHLKGQVTQGLLAGSLEAVRQLAVWLADNSVLSADAPPRPSGVGVFSNTPSSTLPTEMQPSVAGPSRLPAAASGSFWPGAINRPRSSIPPRRATSPLAPTPRPPTPRPPTPTPPSTPRPPTPTAPRTPERRPTPTPPHTPARRPDESTATLSPMDDLTPSPTCAGDGSGDGAVTRSARRAMEKEGKGDIV